MYSDGSGCFAISALLIGALIGAAIGGTFGGIDASKKGDNVFAGVINGALVGGALGLSGALGVAYLGPIIAGTATASLAAAAPTAMLSSMAISALAGGTGYAIEESMNGRDVTLGGVVGNASLVAIESWIVFGVGGIMGSLGTLGDLGDFFSKEWFIKQGFIQEFTAGLKYGINKIRDLFF